MRYFINLMGKWVRGIIEIMAFYPILITIGFILIPQEIWMWLLFLAIIYFMGLVLSQYLKGKPRYLYLLAGLFIALSIGLWLSESINALVLMFFSGIFAFYRGIILRYRPWSEAFPTSALWLGMVAYLILGVIYSLAPDLKAYLPYISWPGFIYTVICLFMANDMHLRAASFKGHDSGGLPLSVIRNNRILVLVSLGLIIIVSNFKALRDGLMGLFRSIIGFIASFFIFISRLLNSTEGGSDVPPESGPMEFLPIESGEPHWVWKVLEKVAIVVALGLMAVLLYYGFKVLHRLIIKLFSHIRAILKKRVSFGEDKGYVDEKESLVSFNEVGRDYIDRARQWVKSLIEKEPKWEDLKDNEERIRFLYRRTILKAMNKGYSFKNYLSPIETGRDLAGWMGDRDGYELKGLVYHYDRVRFGHEEVGDKEVEKLKGHFLEKT